MNNAAKFNRRKSTCRRLLHCDFLQKDLGKGALKDDEQIVALSHSGRLKMFIALVFLLMLIPTLYFHIELKLRANRGFSEEPLVGSEISPDVSAGSQEST